ncbi:MAG: hypothetical protein KatS3mg122_2686 [Caldimonas sp.]|nr:MAG: hypothetical protein KatS3mg122_2686 [Caldimonas sp.]
MADGKILKKILNFAGKWPGPVRPVPDAGGRLGILRRLGCLPESVNQSHLPLDTSFSSETKDAAAHSRGAGRAELAMRTALTLARPIVRWLLRQGVQYGAFVAALKRVFVEVAAEELRRQGRRCTDSALSVLSGVHRKDVRALTQLGRALQRDKPFSPASLVFTRWATDPRWRDPASGRPLRLPRQGEQGSFEALAREVSTDVHPRTLLDELQRLSLVHIDGPWVELVAQSYVPSADEAAMAELLAANGADHLAAAVHNLTTSEPRLLEQSVFASGLSQASAEALGVLARRLWAQDFVCMAEQARQRCQADAKPAQPYRMRFGVYYYMEPEASETDAAHARKESSS